MGVRITPMYVKKCQLKNSLRLHIYVTSTLFSVLSWAMTMTYLVKPTRKLEELYMHRESTAKQIRH